MRIWKSILIFSIVMALLTISVSGMAADKPEKISVIFTAADLPLLQVVAKEYEEKYGIAVELISQSYNATHDKIISTALGGSPVDVTYVDTIWPAEFSTADIIVPLDEYITPELRSQFVDVAIDQMVWNGKTWGVPFVNNSKWLFYNKKMMAESGYVEPPKTWDELFAMGSRMQNAGIAKYAIAWGAAQAEGLICDWTGLLYNFGGKYRDADGKWVFDSDNAVEALTMLVDSINNGLADPASITYNDRTVLNPFMAGDIPFVLDWAFAWSLVNSPAESNVAGNVDIGLVPGAGKPGIPSASVTGGGGYAIMKNSDSKDWAWKFLELLVSEKMQLAAIEKISSIPALKSLYDDPRALKLMPELAKMYPQFQYAHWRPILPWYSEWSQLTQVQLHEALSGRATPEQALKRAVQLSNHKSKVYGY